MNRSREAKVDADANSSLSKNGNKLNKHCESLIEKRSARIVSNLVFAYFYQFLYKIHDKAS